MSELFAFRDNTNISNIYVYEITAFLHNNFYNVITSTVQYFNSIYVLVHIAYKIYLYT